MHTFLHAIVLGFNRFNSTSKLCLDSLIPQLTYEETIQVTAIDNGSTDDSAELLSQYVKKNPIIKVSFHEKNLGFGGGMNRAAQNINCEWLLLVNSDLIFPPSSIKNLIAQLRNMPESIAIACPLTNNAGNGQCISIEGHTQEEIIRNGQIINDQPNLIFTISYRADFCCAVIRKKVWDQLNGLDLSYGRGYYEDFDFSMRAKDLGYDIAICEDVFVYHEGSASFKANTELKQLLKKNKSLFKKRFPHAKLMHQREGNLESIKQIKQKIPSLEFRLNQLKNQTPRSFFKRFLWLRKIQKLLNTTQFPY